ncbi:hypothetical protein MKW94_021194 [Papaver nudicaule]|uniref:Uncharacterized protein n=1 Tax=Papaver nudicaule TaxID=74823 RepID=A0AA41S504_PAPNU|nr:hypothetical protein [Papaver nudicaule]
MDWFSIIITPNSIFYHLTGRTSVWKALNPQVLEAFFNVSPEAEKHFRSKRLNVEIFFPAPSLVWLSIKDNSIQVGVQVQVGGFQVGFRLWGLFGRWITPLANGKEISIFATVALCPWFVNYPRVKTGGHVSLILGVIMYDVSLFF